MASQDWFDKDFYKTLGVSKDISDAELKKTYRKLARKYHPDSNPGDAAAEAKFKEISEAYSVLSDAEQRREYDEIRAMGSGARFTAPGGGGAGGFEDVFSRFGQGSGRQADFDDIFSMFNQGGGSFGGGRFGQSSGGFRGFGGPQKGADVTARTTLDFVTAAQGETITLQAEDGKPFKIKVPAGVDTGTRIQLAGEGEVGPGAGPAGDLYVEVSVDRHPVFQRRGDDLHSTIEVPMTAAALGATLYCPATRPKLADDLARRAAEGATSMVVCLEDSIPDDALAAGEQNAVAQLRHFAGTSPDGPGRFAVGRDYFSP